MSAAKTYGADALTWFCFQSRYWLLIYGWGRAGQQNDVIAANDENLRAQACRNRYYFCAVRIWCNQKWALRIYGVTTVQKFSMLKNKWLWPYIANLLNHKNYNTWNMKVWFTWCHDTLGGILRIVYTWCVLSHEARLSHRKSWFFTCIESVL